jgi:hypothetical protein
MKRLICSARKSLVFLSFLLLAATLLLSADDPIRVGVIGLDTSHSPAFAKLLNNPDATGELAGFDVVAAYPKGSADIESSVSRIPKYTEQFRDMGVEIVDSIDELLEKVDVVLLETNDGRPHYQQALQVYDAAAEYDVPVFSSSALRYYGYADSIASGAAGDILEANTWSPAPIEITHPDLYWYGIHGVEMLFTAMGTGCETVIRASSEGSDVVTGIWGDGRIGTFRGLRRAKRSYGGTVFGTEAVMDMGGYNGYEPLVREIATFFKTGEAPVSPEETLEIYAFMTAADLSKRLNGQPVNLQAVLDDAIRQARE